MDKVGADLWSIKLVILSIKNEKDDLTNDWFLRTHAWISALIHLNFLFPLGKA